MTIPQLKNVKKKKRNEKTMELYSQEYEARFGIMMKCYVPLWEDLIFQDVFSPFDLL